MRLNVAGIFQSLYPDQWPSRQRRSNVIGDVPDWKGVAVAENQHVALVRHAAYDVGQCIQLARVIDQALDRATVVELFRMVVPRFVAERKYPEGVTNVLSQARDLHVNPEIGSPMDRKNIDHRHVLWV